MNARVKKQWVEALVSGDYEQTRKALRDDKGYCCLGVLCDLHAKETGNEWVHPSSSPSSYLGSMSRLPSVVVQWAELGGHDPYLGKDPATYLNDGALLNFGEIAAIVERYL